MDHIDEMLGRIGLSKRQISEAKKIFKNEDPRSSSHGRIEGLKVRGHLTIDGIADGRRWRISDKNNMVTNTGFLVLASMWGGPSGDTFDNYRPWWIAAGTGSHGPTPAMTIDTLEMAGSPTYQAHWDQRVFLADPETTGVKFEMTIPEGSANGDTLTEAGLFSYDYNGSSTGNGGMIAYQTYGGIIKTSSFAVLYSWAFNFSTA